MPDPLYNIDPDAPPKITPEFPAAKEGMGGANPLRAICSAWIEKIKKGCEFKEKQFGRDARDCMKFFNGPYDFMYGSSYMDDSNGLSAPGATERDMPAPTFKMTLNKVMEGVQLFGPVLYHRNPYRQVNPRRLPEIPFGLLASFQVNPTAQQMLGQQEAFLQQQEIQTKQTDAARSSLLEWMLNYTPQELNLKEESRMSIEEGLIKGGGVLWVETYQPKGSAIKLVGSFHDTYDNLVLDPDAERLQDCKWIARRCTHPYWEVEEEYGLPPGSLKGRTESLNQQAEVAASPDGEHNRKRGLTNDLVVYWKVYSKMGVGAKLAGTPKEFRDVLDSFGEYCYMVVADGVPYPLNLPDQVVSAAQNDEEIFQRLEWPTPFWMDDEWPMAELAFHRGPRQLYPISHFKPAMGELKAMNWIYSFIISNIQVTSRTFIAMKSTVAAALKNAVLRGGNLTCLEIDATNSNEDINKIVQFLEHPQFNGDIWKVLEAISEAFDKRTGLSELVYGMSSRQMRSAQEASIKGDAINVRPDDMADRVEEWMSKAAKLEAMAIRWHVTGADVAPLMGPAASYYWDQLVTNSDPYAMFHQLQYGIEAGSTKKPNKERDAANINTAMQSFFPAAMSEAQRTGNFQQVNAFIAEWCRTTGADPQKFMFPNMPPAQPPPPDANAQPQGPPQ